MDTDAYIAYAEMRSALVSLALSFEKLDNHPLAQSIICRGLIVLHAMHVHHSGNKEIENDFEDTARFLIRCITGTQPNLA